MSCVAVNRSGDRVSQAPEWIGVGASIGIIRSLFLVACLGCVGIIAWNGRWEARLTCAEHTWIVDLDPAPVWAPPEVPSYARFKHDFKDSEDFPAEESPGLSIRGVLKLDWVAVDLLLYLWPVTLIGAALYLALRGGDRDLVLHCAMSVSVGMTLAALACIGLWLLYGGWGPPAPELFGGLGLVGGLIAGLASFYPRRA